MIYIMSFNGAKFDNHFIVRAFKHIFKNQWERELKITGTITDIKIL